MIEKGETVVHTRDSGVGDEEVRASWQFPVELIDVGGLMVLHVSDDPRRSGRVRLTVVCHVETLIVLLYTTNTIARLEYEWFP